MSGTTINPMSEFLRRSKELDQIARESILKKATPEERTILIKRFHEAEGARHQDTRPE